MRGDRRADVGVERGDRLAGEIFVPVEQREGALLGGQRGGGEIGRALDRAEPCLGRGDRVGRAVAQPHMISASASPVTPEADAALLPRLLLLLPAAESARCR